MASQRKGIFEFQSVGKELCLGSNHLDVPNATGEHRVPKFQEKATRSNDVTLDCCTAPSTPVDCHSQWGFANAVEPASPDPVRAVIENPNRVERILGSYQHTVTHAEVTFSDLFKGTGMLGYRLQAVFEVGQCNPRRKLTTLPTLKYAVLA